MDLWGDIESKVLSNEVWGKQVVRTSVDNEALGALFSWSALNKILEEHAIPAPRLRLVRRGSQLDPSKYQRLEANGQPGLVIPKALTSLLSTGSTLVLDAVEEMFRPLREFAKRFDERLGERVFVNLYASWGGHDDQHQVHWDDAHILVLQVSGMKRWTVWQPSPAAPCLSESEGASKPVWEGVLRAGEILHVPRGWWHLVEGLNSPSLHLAVTVPVITGKDVARWFMSKVLARGADRLEAPLLGTEGEQQRWFEEVGKIITDTWMDHQLSRFLEDVCGRGVTRPRLELPFL